ncbi:MAG: S41 family peptidase [Fusobacteria bacterium]|nr:S41 family peptidase [Fusobacteriota bacterium]
MNGKSIFLFILKVVSLTVLSVFAFIGLVSLFILSLLVKNPQEIFTAYQTYNIINNNFYQEIDPAKLISGITEGLVDSLDDQYSEYFTAEEWKEYTAQLNGIYAGIGMLLGEDKDTKLVKGIKVFEGSPAAKAGLKVGDLILAIDGESTEGLNVEEVATKVRGEAGTNVTLKVFRDREELEFTITRAQIKVPSVSGKLINNNKTLYIEISSFGESTSTELAELLSSYPKLPDSIVLDLRNNGGGLVAQSMEVARYFIKGGTVLYEVGREESSLENLTVDGEKYLNKKLVVLVNGNTASASEILTGAIQDYKTGTIVGEQTFGKGVVQSMFNLSDGGIIKLTTKRYLTPNKRDINKEGIKPDIVVVMSKDELEKVDTSRLPDEINDLQLVKAIEVINKQ